MGTSVSALRLIVTVGPKQNKLLEISPAASLEELKAAIMDLTGVSPHQQRLRYW
jgi:hypothetical protein